MAAVFSGIIAAIAFAAFAGLAALPERPALAKDLSGSAAIAKPWPSWIRGALFVR